MGMMSNRLVEAKPTELGTKSFSLTLPNSSALRININQQLNRTTVQGSVAAVDSFARLVKAIDTPASVGDDNMQLVSLNNSTISSTRRAVEAMQTASMDDVPRKPVVTKLFQNAKDGQTAKTAPTMLAQAQGTPREEDQDQTAEVMQAPGDMNLEQKLAEIGQIGPVQVEMLEGLDILIVRGHKKDVEQVMNIIKQVEQLSTKTEPAIEIYKLLNIDCQALADLLLPLYSEVFYARQGSVSITALVKPNALLIMGRKENVKTAIDLIKKLDLPTPPNTQFRVFALHHTSSSEAYTTVSNFYSTSTRLGLAPRVLVSEDSRSNSLIVQASPTDMAEVADLISRIDTKTSPAVNELKIIPLEHSLAANLATIIQDAIGGQGSTARTQTGTQGMQGFQQPGQTARPNTASSSTRSAILRFLTVDAKNNKPLESGILSDVTVSADARSNSIVISAPPESMPLLEALVHELDRLPMAEAQVKVFTIVNGDATNLSLMLQGLFGTSRAGGQTGATGGFGGTGGFGAGAQTGGLQAIALEGEGSLIPIRIATDTRTNTIIASGSANDLLVIEAILLRLDSGDVRNRESHVYRLKNAPASNVSTAINQFLTNVRSMQTQISSGAVSPFEQLEREVIVVPETVSNSLIVSATPRFFNEIKAIIEKLDERPPMVMIQVLIAEVTLSDQDEFGVELGLQDGLLFDRKCGYYKWHDWKLAQSGLCVQ